MLSAAYEVSILQVVEAHGKLLSAPVLPDEFLREIGRNSSSHRFLANSAQGVARRQVAFLAAVLKDHLAVLPAEIKVLDWGCGKGHITYLLRNHSFDVTSCDIVSEKNDSTFGQEVPIIEQQKITVVPLRHPSQLPFDDASFDCVVSFGVLEHVPSDIASLHEIRRILKPGGVFYITLLPFFLSWGQAFARLRGITYHDRLYSRSQVYALAKQARFEVVGLLHAQLFPKNSVPVGADRVLEPLDRVLCHYTPLKYFATNLEALLVAV